MNLGSIHMCYQGFVAGHMDTMLVITSLNYCYYDTIYNHYNFRELVSELRRI